MFTTICAFIIGYLFLPITSFVTVLFTAILIDGEFNFGLMDRILDVTERINKTKGISK